jgi:hypothetical protein
MKQAKIIKTNPCLRCVPSETNCIASGNECKEHKLFVKQHMGYPKAYRLASNSCEAMFMD